MPFADRITRPGNPASYHRVRRPESIRQVQPGASQTIQKMAEESPRGRYAAGIQALARDHAARQLEASTFSATNQTPYVVQREFTGAQERSFNGKYGKNQGDSAGAGSTLKELGPVGAWQAINDFIRGLKLKKKETPPTVEEIAKHYGVEVSKPEAKPTGEESSDVKERYEVSKGCALQGLVNYPGLELPKSSAHELHDHLWSTKGMEKFRDYDVSWENYYKHLGLKQIKNPAEKIGEIKTPGWYLCETHGHMIAVEVTKKGEVKMHQDPGNAIGKLTDQIIKTYQ